MATSDDVPRSSPRDEPVPAFGEEAFRQFHDDTFRTVWTVARRICRDDEEAHDVCQNAYVAVYRYWRDGRLMEPPRRLLFRVVQRGAVDVIRARARRQRLARAMPEPPEAGPWLAAEIRDALRRLDARDAALLVMQAEVGLTYEELAAVVRQSVPAVRSRLYRARRELARQLDRRR